MDRETVIGNESLERSAGNPRVSGNADAARLIHTRSMFAFNCWSNATAATDAPGRRHAAMAAALNAAVCRRRRRFSSGCISVHLQISGHYRHAKSPTTVDDFAGRLRSENRPAGHWSSPRAAEPNTRGRVTP